MIKDKNLQIGYLYSIDEIDYNISNENITCFNYIYQIIKKNCLFTNIFSKYQID